jgi:hypothetical protein
MSDLSGTSREGRHLFVALPWYKSASPLTTFSLLAMADRSRMAFGLGFGDAFIAHSRNKLATQFVNSTLEWMLMVDDDMVLPFGDAAWFNGTTQFRLDDKFAGLHTVIVGWGPVFWPLEVRSSGVCRRQGDGKTSSFGRSPR